MVSSRTWNGTFESTGITTSDIIDSKPFQSQHVSDHVSDHVQWGLSEIKNGKMDTVLHLFTFILIICYGHDKLHYRLVFIPV